MSRAGDVIESPVTSERVVRLGTEETGGELLVVDAYVRPGGAVTGEHVHPAIEEYFTVVSGRVGFRLDGRESIAELGQRLHVPAGMAHAGGTRAERRRTSQPRCSPVARTTDKNRQRSSHARSPAGSLATSGANPTGRDGKTEEVKASHEEGCGNGASPHLKKVTKRC